MWAKMQQQTRIVTTFHNAFIRGGPDSFFKYVKLDRDLKRTLNELTMPLRREALIIRNYACI